MRRLKVAISIWMAVVLLVGLVSCAKPVSSGSEFNSKAEQDNNIDAQAIRQDFLADDLLPDIPASDVSLDWLIKYEPVTTAQLDEYIKNLEGQGFTCRREMYNICLWREDAFISISNNTVDFQDFSVRIFRQSKTENGLSADEAKAVIHDDRVSILIEQTPEGFYEKTGAQLFLAPMDRSVDGVNKHPANQGMVTKYYLVTERDSVYIDRYRMTPLAADIDHDGTTEIIWIGNGFTSGVFSFSLWVYRVEDGKIHQEAMTCYQSNFYWLYLRQDADGKVWLDYMNQEENHQDSTGMFMQDGHIRLEDQENFYFAGTQEVW